MTGSMPLDEGGPVEKANRILNGREWNARPDDDGTVKLALAGSGWPEDGADCGHLGLTGDEELFGITLVPKAALAHTVEVEKERDEALDFIADWYRNTPLHGATTYPAFARDNAAQRLLIKAGRQPDP